MSYYWLCYNSLALNIRSPIKRQHTTFVTNGIRHCHDDDEWRDCISHGEMDELSNTRHYEYVMPYDTEGRWRH